MAEDWLAIVEAAYRVELGEVEWLEGLLSAARGVFDEGLGMSVMMYRGTPDSGIVPERLISGGAVNGMSPQHLIYLIRDAFLRSDSLSTVFWNTPCGLATESFFAEAPAVLSYLDEHGLTDAWAVNGRVSSVEGCLLLAYLSKSRRPSVRALRRAARIAHALSNAIRLRRQLAIARVVERPDSAVVRAARADLALRRDADAEHSTRLHDAAPEPANLGGHDGLRPVDQFSFEGVSYVILRSTERPSNFEQLSPREREVLAHAASGCSNKAIGYELGVAASTVGVLLCRGARKLGAGSRGEAIARYREGGGGAYGPKSAQRGRRSGRRS